MVLPLLAGVAGLAGGLLEGNEKRNQAKHQNREAARIREAGLADYEALTRALFGLGGIEDRNGGLLGQALQELLGVRPLLEQGYGDAGRLTRRGMREQAGRYEQSIDDLRAGYAQAGEQLNQVGSASRNQIARNKDAGVSAGTARAARMGLLTTSADLERSARGDAQSALARLGESLAGMRSGLAEREGRAVGQTRQAIGDIYGQGFGRLSGLAQQRGQALGAHQASVAQAILDRANAYQQVQQSRANFRLGAPQNTYVPSSGSVLGSALVQGLSGGLSTHAAMGGFQQSPGRSIPYGYPHFNQGY